MHDSSGVSGRWILKLPLAGVLARLAASSWTLLLTVTLAFGQTSTTATLRGTIVDSTGGVLPGATVTLTNAGTRGAQATVTGDAGGYFFGSLFPGTYSLKVELSGFKTHEEQGIVISPNDTRGIDIRLEIGAQTERITVKAQGEVIQTATGAREGVLSAKQIDNLSVMGRSALELLRILPGVVTEFNVGEFSNGDVAAYTVNGIRSSNNTATLDRSSLVDIGCNCGLMVSLNDDMISEVKIQSSNFAAEYGSGGMNVSAVTKSGTSQFHGGLYDYIRDPRLSANDRSNSSTGVPKPKSKFQYPGGNIGGPLFFGDSYTKNRDKLFFFVAFESQRQQVDSGARLSRTYTPAMKRGDFRELLANQGSNLNSTPQLLIPLGFPGAGEPAPNNDMTPYVTPFGSYLASLYPDPNYHDPDNLYNYVYSALEPNNRTDLKMRFDWNVRQNTKLFVRLARNASENVNPRGAWWGASDFALPTPNVDDEHSRSLSANVVSVLSPSTTNEAVFSYTRLALDNSWQDPSKVARGTGGVDFVGIFPEAPEMPTNLVHGWGNGQVGSLWSAVPNVFAHNDALQFSDKLTKLLGTHGMKFGVSIERGQKQQNFSNDESGLLWFSTDNSTSTGNSGADMLVGRIAELDQGTARNGKPVTGMPNGEFRYWNIDGFAQDSWKVRRNLTVEYGVRFGFWTNNRELSGEGGYFTPSLYDPNAGSFLDPDTLQHINGECYVYTGCAPAGILANRSAFALPRINAAWDIDGEGRNVLRGGYGLFLNRPQGNIEYSSTLNLAPNRYHVSTDFWAGADYGNGLGLTYDTAHEATLANRIGTLGVESMSPESFHFPQTHSFSVSFARRMPWNQVLEASYVGTRGRRLLVSENGNIMPYGVLNSGTYNGVDLSVPVNRVAVASNDTSLASFRQFNALSSISLDTFRGVSNYNSLQITLSRQTGRRVQYFVAYTLSSTHGTTGGDFGRIDPYDATRTYGVLSEDRRHILNVSWNALLPDAARGPLDHVVLRGVLNGWQLSGISTLVSGTPILLSFAGDAGTAPVSAAWFGTADVVGPNNQSGAALAPAYTCDPRLTGSRVGRQDPRYQLPRDSDVRRTGQPAAAVRLAQPDARESRPDRVQELSDPRRSEAAAPRRILQPVQPGERRRRHQPRARHDMPRES